VTFLKFEQSFLNDKEQNSSNHFLASKVSPLVLINVIFLLKVWYCEVWNTHAAILTQCKEAEDLGYRSWYSHPLKTERFEFRTQVDVIYFLRLTPVLKVLEAHPAFYILDTEAFFRG
jgi:hypothetical protein